MYTELKFIEREEIMKTISLQKVLTIACQMEENAHKFYTKLLESNKIPKKWEFKSTLQSVIEMEARHLTEFQKYLSQISDDKESKKEFKIEEADLNFFKSVSEHFHSLPNEKKRIDFSSIQNLLCEALEMEHESILFYSGLKNIFPTEINTQIIDEIISEEILHASSIYREIQIIE